MALLYEALVLAACHHGLAQTGLCGITRRLCQACWNAVAANTWNTEIWKPALAKAGVIPPLAKGAKPWQGQAAPRDGFHVLRHTHASVVLEAGEPVVTSARWLGHASPTITLHHYAHFMPEAGRRGRQAIDSLLGDQANDPAGRNSPDSPQARS
ncbi:MULTISPECIES: hypothetical protein [Streptomyces]|uniref:Integrase n=1 Tax=Streptomyces clavifer TaxID=68188 RepID=A0ABS4V2K8_9ACTN|nr:MULTISPECIES: hypothetical protein [Streptomyces]MBP2358031.1 hypothetical protein [Streptomyces clavifer]MDX2742303.1 hypothetical protein [Streptomyces sp. NRRL_B-2557]WRY85183.1 hypothetical protein OG388_30095 [Streptomyces clavifer]WUC30889.1 hypothetical protein OG927_27650 [Streptomyces clavifer]GHA87976.1 hypothetical protein GCM10010392_12970 [Streptomyces clavifer]